MDTGHSHGGSTASCLLSGNRISSYNASGIFVDNKPAGNVTITGNEISDSGAGIELNKSAAVAIVSTLIKMYTYPCPGIGGHSEYVAIYNESGPVAEAYWSGYEGDYHNIIFNTTFILFANHTYNYTIVQAPIRRSIITGL